VPGANWYDGDAHGCGDDGVSHQDHSQRLPAPPGPTLPRGPVDLVPEADPVPR